MHSAMTRQTMPLGQAQPHHPLLSHRHAQFTAVGPQPMQGNQHSDLTTRAVRKQKDPAQFANMDEAREYLMQPGRKGRGGPIAGALNWLSNAAFGAGRAGAHVGSLYRQWLSLNADREHRSSTGGAAAAALANASPESIASLALVMLVSEHRVQKLAAMYPQVLAMPVADVAARLVLLKELLPGSDVARMVELAPGLLLGASEGELQAAKQRVDVLTAHLPGADVAFMVQEDPNLMFEELEPSLPRMYELWPELDAATLAASDPKHLALALRALSDQGPPRRF